MSCSKAVNIILATSWERFLVAMIWAEWRAQEEPVTSLEVYAAAIELSLKVVSLGLNMSD